MGREDERVRLRGPLGDVWSGSGFADMLRRLAFQQSCRWEMLFLYRQASADELRDLQAAGTLIKRRIQPAHNRITLHPKNKTAIQYNKSTLPNRPFSHKINAKMR
jgi:hypothetical protein